MSSQQKDSRQPTRLCKEDKSSSFGGALGQVLVEHRREVDFEGLTVTRGTASFPERPALYLERTRIRIVCRMWHMYDFSSRNACLLPWAAFRLFVLVY